MDVAAFWVSFASVVLAGVSATMAVLSFLSARKSGRDASESADRANAAYDRLADAQQVVASLAKRESEAPPWRLEWRSGDTYLLTNLDPRAAVDVEVASDDPSLVETPKGGWPSVIGPKSAILFWAVRTFGTSSQMVEVRWRIKDDEVLRSWRYPLPSRGDK